MGPPVHHQQYLVLTCSHSPRSKLSKASFLVPRRHVRTPPFAGGPPSDRREEHYLQTTHHGCTSNFPSANCLQHSRRLMSAFQGDLARHATTHLRRFFCAVFSLLFCSLFLFIHSSSPLLLFGSPRAYRGGARPRRSALCASKLRQTRRPRIKG